MWIEAVDIGIGSLSNRGIYGQMINLTSKKNEKSMIFSGAGMTQSLKIVLIISHPKTKQSLKEVGLSMMQRITEINVYGCTANCNPSPILLTSLLNICESFNKIQLMQEAAETYFLVALSLVNSRRFVQAAETLRKVS